MDVVDAIGEVEVEDNPYGPGGEVSLPIEDVIIEYASRIPTEE